MLFNVLLGVEKLSTSLLNTSQEDNIGPMYHQSMQQTNGYYNYASSESNHQIPTPESTPPMTASNQIRFNGYECPVLGGSGPLGPFPPAAIPVNEENGTPMLEIMRLTNSYARDFPSTKQFTNS